MGLTVKTSVGAELEDLLRGNPVFEFKVIPWKSPNGWRIIGWKRSASWFANLFLGGQSAHMGPPYEIRTSNLELAFALTASLSNTPFNVVMER